MKEKYNYLEIYDELGELDYEYADLAHKLAIQENVGITSDRELFQAISDENGNLIAASWISWDGENYEWDVVVDKLHQGNGIGKELIDSCIQNFDEYKEMNEEATMDITVTSDIMVNALKNRGFQISQKISDGFYKMEQKSEVENFLLNKISSNEEDIKKEFNPETTFYHGNANKVHRFSKVAPSFFTIDPEYAKGYGNYVYQYKIDTKQPFDTATDEEARNYYNNVFLNHELGKDATKIEKGKHIHFNDADNFWAFISVEEQIGNGLGYDSIVVDEKVGEHYKSHLSIVPFDNKQIKQIKNPSRKQKPNKI